MSMSKHLRDLVQERMSRRNFLRGAAAMSAGAAISVGPVSTAAAAAESLSRTKTSGVARQPTGMPFTPIEPSSADELVVPEGFTTQVLIKRGDVFTADGKTFGDNADWTGWYPIDGLTGGNSATEGLVVINNEYLNPIFVSDFDGSTDKTAAQIAIEKEAVGIAVVHVKKEADGKWSVVKDSTFAKRFDMTAATTIALSGPAAGGTAVGSKSEVIGTGANCSGGQTPWLTALSCEENYQDYYGEDSLTPAAERSSAYNWQKDEANAQMPEHYGWVVEVDPYTGVAKKRTALGRFRHENVAIGIGKSGKVVAYMGDDKRDEVVYKFISDKVYDTANREANMDILDAGKLYAANFANGSWIEVTWTGNEEKLGNPKNVGGYTLAGQADVLTYASNVARFLGATRTDRPEDIEINPKTGDIYIAFTNNSNHGNFHGQISRLMETDGDYEALTFGWDIFSVGGPQSGYSSPDNLIFDKHANLWMVTDASSSGLNKGIYKFMGNNSLFMIPTEGENAGKAFRFASGPTDCELTGPTWIDGNTLILAVQHPGEESESKAEPSSHWPDGGTTEPRAAVVLIYGPFDAM